jgi:hypothetical protein
MYFIAYCSFLLQLPGPTLANFPTRTGTCSADLSCFPGCMPPTKTYFLLD